MLALMVKVVCLPPVSADSHCSPCKLVSMYRNINYDNVTKDHKKTKQPEEPERHSCGAGSGGGGSGGWKKSTRAFAQNLVGSPGKRHFKGAVNLAANCESC